MHTAERPIHLQVVTSSKDRVRAFGTLLSEHVVTQSQPKFTESIIHRPINSSPSEWPFEVAKEKALQDLAGLLVQGISEKLATDHLVGDINLEQNRVIRLYSDTVQVSYSADSPDIDPIVLEKPLSLERWLIDRESGALAQSGKNFEICTALTGIDLGNKDAHPSTILVRIAGKMRPYNLAEVVDVINHFGESEMTAIAGGISIQNGGTVLYDKKEPLRAYIQYDPNAQPQLLFEIPTWEHLDRDTLQRFVYGAIPEAFEALITQIDNSTYANTFSKK